MVSVVTFHFTLPIVEMLQRYTTTLVTLVGIFDFVLVKFQGRCNLYKAWSKIGMIAQFGLTANSRSLNEVEKGVFADLQ